MVFSRCSMAPPRWAIAMGVGPSRNAYRTGTTGDTLTPLVHAPSGTRCHPSQRTPPSHPCAGAHGADRACPTVLSVPTSTVRSVGKRDGIRAIREEAPTDAGLPGPRRGSDAERRCGWCRRVLPQQGSVGRPRQYCGQACRQRAYEQRSATAKAGLSGDVVLVTRAELDGLQDRLYQLRCALRSEEHTSELQSPCNLVC